MNRRRNMLIVMAALAPHALAPFAAADDYRFASLRVDHLFARATPPGAKTGGVFFTVENEGKTGDRLVRASSPIAGAVELHQMTLDAGVMKMRAVQSVEVKPHAKIEFKPGGYHLMLLDLKQPLKSGDKFPLTLTFERAGTLETLVRIEDMGATPNAARKH